MDVRLAEAWCSCLVRPVPSLVPGKLAIEVREPCAAHTRIGPAGFDAGERRTYLPGSPLDGAVVGAMRRAGAS